MGEPCWRAGCLRVWPISRLPDSGLHRPPPTISAGYFGPPCRVGHRRFAHFRRERGIQAFGRRLWSLAGVFGLWSASLVPGLHRVCLIPRSGHRQHWFRPFDGRKELRNAYTHVRMPGFGIHQALEGEKKYGGRRLHAGPTPGCIQISSEIPRLRDPKIQKSISRSGYVLALLWWSEYGFYAKTRFAIIGSHSPSLTRPGLKLCMV